MNILLHIASLGTGGAERQLVCLAKGLADKEHQVHVVTLYQRGMFWDELKDDGRIILHSLERRGRWDFLVVYKLWKYCRNHAIDLALAFLPVCSVIAALPAKLCHIPLVMGLRASNASNMDYPLGSRLYLLGERILGNRFAARFVANSYAGAAYHRQLGYTEEKLQVIANGLQIPDHDFSPPFSSNRTITIGFVGRLDPMKGIPDLLEAMVLVAASVDARLVVYGEGDPAYKSLLQQLAIELGIAGAVTWPGWADAVWTVLEQMDIYVSSSYGEGMSNSLMEAMASGRVIVATDVGDAGIMLNGDEHGRAGYLVPPASPAALTEAILKAVENPNESIQRAELAKRLAGKLFSSTVMVDRYASLFNELAALNIEQKK